jgi:hypothetical protein
MIYGLALLVYQFAESSRGCSCSRFVGAYALLCSTANTISVGLILGLVAGGVGISRAPASLQGYTLATGFTNMMCVSGGSELHILRCIIM